MFWQNLLRIIGDAVHQRNCTASIVNDLFHIEQIVRNLWWVLFEGGVFGGTMFFVLSQGWMLIKTFKERADERK